MTKETLSNGKKISNLLYVMNPLREPSKRIHHFQLLFSKEDNTEVYYQTPKINKISTLNKKNQKLKNINKKKKKTFSKNFFKFYYQRPSDIFDKKGVIVSRHYKPLELNNKTFPKSQMKYQSFSDKGINIKNSLYSNTSTNRKYRSFFDTEIKIPINNQNKNFSINGTRSIPMNKKSMNSVFSINVNPIKGNSYLLEPKYNDNDNIPSKFGATNKNWTKTNFFPSIKNNDNFLIEYNKDNKTENNDD